MEKQHLRNREDSTKWDNDMFRNDVDDMADFDLPFTSGVFPAPEYHLVGENSFRGLGNTGFPGGEGTEFTIEGKIILFNSFFVKTNVFNKNYIDSNKKDEVFFHIVVLTDYVDTTDYSHVSSEIVSRNHPDYIGQGFYKTKNNRIDYAAFITADRNAYAIINMRLFDLTQGKTILIAPQKDRSFRSMQIHSPELSGEDMENYTRELLKKDIIQDFFTAPGNI